MINAFIKLFKGHPKVRVHALTDPILGSLESSADANSWEASVTVGGKTIAFKIGGDTEPDTVLIAHAHEIVREFSKFETMVNDFLADEARRMPAAASEIQQLKLTDIMLYWRERPDDGMIYFKGPDKFRVWRCDYIGRKPRHLGFDS